MAVDFTTELGRAAARRLRSEQVIWLITLRADGRPWPNPVWFVWDEEGFLLYSPPGSAKMRHITGDPRVSLHLNGEGWGNDIVIIEGEARIADREPPPDRNPDYLEKYKEGIARIGMTVEEFARTYSTPVRVRFLSLRGH